MEIPGVNVIVLLGVAGLVILLNPFINKTFVSLDKLISEGNLIFI